MKKGTEYEVTYNGNDLEAAQDNGWSFVETHFLNKICLHY